MELKSECTLISAALPCSSNRTFMELKLKNTARPALGPVF